MGIEEIKRCVCIKAIYLQDGIIPGVENYRYFCVQVVLVFAEPVFIKVSLLDIVYLEQLMWAVAV